MSLDCNMVGVYCLDIICRLLPCTTDGPASNGHTSSTCCRRGSAFSVNLCIQLVHAVVLGHSAGTLCGRIHRHALTTALCSARKSKPLKSTPYCGHRHALTTVWSSGCARLASTCGPATSPWLPSWHSSSPCSGRVGTPSFPMPCFTHVLIGVVRCKPPTDPHPVWHGYQ